MSDRLFLFDEEPDSRESTTDPPTLTLHYLASGEPSDAIAGEYADVALPSSVFTVLGQLFRQNLTLSPDGYARYRVTVVYGTQNKDVGSFNFRFDTTGATIKIKAAKEHIGAFTSAGADATNVHQGAIGVTMDMQVEGCDVIVPALKLDYTFKHPQGIVSEDFAKTLAAATGRTNSSSWRSFAAGELLYLGSSGSGGSDAVAEVEYSFIASQNVTNLQIGNIANIIKKGFEYAWVECKPAVVAGQPAIQPRRVNIERVYDAVDFGSYFGWG